MPILRQLAQRAHVAIAQDAGSKRSQLAGWTQCGALDVGTQPCRARGRDEVDVVLFSRDTERRGLTQSRLLPAPRVAVIRGRLWRRLLACNTVQVSPIEDPTKIQGWQWIVSIKHHLRQTLHDQPHAIHARAPTDGQGSARCVEASAGGRRVKGLNLAAPTTVRAADPVAARSSLRCIL